MSSTGRTRSPRRSPPPDERRVDVDRTRSDLLDAALEEFAAKGFAGARVRDIADRAGVSKDLISYHFGGKDGLYRAVQRAWLEREADFSAPDVPLRELITRYVDDALSDPRPMRLLAWRGLTADTVAPPDTSPPVEDLSTMRARQDRGELAGDLDPASIRLVLLGAVAVPVVFPQLATRLFGVEVTDPAFQARYEDGLRRLVDRLA